MATFTSKGKGFSLAFGEWTLVRNIRYLNINFHSSNEFIRNTGGVRLHGRVPTEK